VEESSTDGANFWFDFPVGRVTAANSKKITPMQKATAAQPKITFQLTFIVNPPQSYPTVEHHT
jgi:hypothetical protein